MWNVFWSDSRVILTRKLVKHLRSVFRRHLVLLSAAMALSAVLSGCAEPEIAAAMDAARPNIVVVVTDDQGYTDLGTHGIASDVQTPNIDQLAADGILMTSGYSTAPQCTPCLLYTSPSPRDKRQSRMPSSA